MKIFFTKHLRRIVQWAFLGLILWIGVEFYLFVDQLRRGAVVTVTRPPGVEGFLPISALINVKYWLSTGTFTTIHPAATVLLLIFIAMAVWLKKGFCSWICPIGLLSELLAGLHVRIFDRPHRLPRWLDLPLRSLKYWLLFFFIYAVFFEMDVASLHRFIDSPYNRVADIKMLLFFSEASLLTLRVLAVLLLLSLLIPYFWCRYLCPYGGLLGGWSLLSPLKIRRNPITCIDCEKCTRVCPAAIRVHEKKTVRSDECHACFQCVEACPVRDTLQFSTNQDKWNLSKRTYAVALVALFLFGTSLAMILGVWQNSISIDEYRQHIQHLHEPAYQHNRGQVPDVATEEKEFVPSPSLR